MKSELGKKVFTTTAQPSCVVCHTLKDAGANGKVGPDLDELKPDTQRVIAAVTKGAGAMPPYVDRLSAEEIQALARYIATATQGSN